MGVLGGPLKERWLYAQPRDEERLPERIQFTLQMHADMEVQKGSSQDAVHSWTEDCDGVYVVSDGVTNSPEAQQTPPKESEPHDDKVHAMDPFGHNGDLGKVEIETDIVLPTTSNRSRWQRRVK